ncbi:hypothetical protein [Streptomyces lydicus]|uniref:hypothetical protein n=1 Tax=Streptomyces lydicus TaxID=47763 RepID=UPI0036E216FC
MHYATTKSNTTELRRQDTGKVEGYCGKFAPDRVDPESASMGLASRIMRTCRKCDEIAEDRRRAELSLADGLFVTELATSSAPAVAEESLFSAEELADLYVAPKRRQPRRPAAPEDGGLFGDAELQFVKADTAAVDADDAPEAEVEAVDPGFTLTVGPEGIGARPSWGMGRSAERAVVLRGHVTPQDAEAAVEAYPEAIAVHGRGTGPNTSVMHVAGVSLDLDATGEGYAWGGPQGATLVRVGDPYRGMLPDGISVAGTWHEVGRAFGAWLISNRPEFVCAMAECQANGARIRREREAEAAADAATGAVMLGQVRTDATRAQVAFDVIGPYADDMSDAMYDAVCGVARRAREAAQEVERAYRARGFRFGAEVARHAADVAKAEAELWGFAERSGLTLPRVARVAPPVAADVQAAPGTVDAWEPEGDACPEGDVPHASEGGQEATSLAPCEASTQVARLPIGHPRRRGVSHRREPVKRS